jgi:hypothetical protein
MGFPATRMRRLRQTAPLRGLTRETELSAGHLVYPMFVVAGTDRRTPIASMPGIDHLSIDHAVEEAGSAHALGIPAVLLFGLPAAKDEQGSGAWDDEGVVQLATRAIKAAHPDLLVIADSCMCEYTSHGHCGVLRADGSSTTTRRSSCSRAPPSRRPARARRDRAERHDGRARRCHPPRARRRGPQRRADRRLLGQVRLGLLRARSARPRTRRRRSATAAATRWIPPTATRRCARRSSTSRRAPTS